MNRKLYICAKKKIVGWVNIEMLPHHFCKIYGPCNTDSVKNGLNLGYLHEKKEDISIKTLPSPKSVATFSHARAGFKPWHW